MSRVQAQFSSRLATRVRERELPLPIVMRRYMGVGQEDLRGGGKQEAHTPDLPPAKSGPDEVLVLVLVLQESRRHDAPARRRLGHSHREVDDRGAAAGDGSLVQSPLGPYHPHVHAVVDGRLDDQRRQQTEHEIGGRGTSASSVRVRVNQRLGFRKVGV